MPQATIIIINYNSGDRLKDVYASLAGQSFTDFDVMLWDNASVDESANTPVPDGLTVHVHQHSDNLGFAGGVMAAIEQTRSPWVAVLNPDAYPEPGWLQALMSAAERYGEKTVLGSIQTIANQPDRLDGLGDVYHISGVAWRGGFQQSRNLIPKEDQEIFAACFAATLFHRDTFLETGGLDTDFFCYHEDVDFGFRNRLFGGRAILVHDAIVAHEGSGITGRFSEFTVYHGIRNRQWTMWKNMPLALLPIALPLNLAFNIGFIFRAFMLGHGKAQTRGFLAGFSRFGEIMKKRSAVIDQQTTPTGDVMRAMSWSLIAPFRRAHHFRPVAKQLRAIDD